MQAATTKILPTKCLNIAQPRIFCPPKITRYTVCHLYLKFQKICFIYVNYCNKINVFLLCRQPCYNYYFVRLGGCNLCLSSEHLLPPPSFACMCKNVIGTVSYLYCDDFWNSWNAIMSVDNTFVKTNGLITSFLNSRLPMRPTALAHWISWWHALNTLWPPVTFDLLLVISIIELSCIIMVSILPNPAHYW